MERDFRIIGTFVLFVFIAPIAAFKIYDLYWFQPHQKYIQSVLDSASPEDRAPPDMVFRLVKISDGNNMDFHIARNLINIDNALPPNERHLPWMIHSTLWSLLLEFHYSEAERMILYCTLVYVGSGHHGLNQGALDLFGQPLSKLSLEQAATVVELLRAPDHLKESPETLTRYRNELMEKYKYQH